MDVLTRDIPTLKNRKKIKEGKNLSFNVNYHDYYNCHDAVQNYWPLLKSVSNHDQNLWLFLKLKTKRNEIKNVV